MHSQKIALLLLTLGGFALRLHYLTTSHPFFDEYTTVLAARQILRHGWPLLPSGLFYEHGLLSTYLIAPFTALFINTPVADWQAAHWGLMLARWPSLLLSTATIPLIYAIARRCFQPTPSSPISQSPNLPISDYQSPIPLLAAGLFAFSPEGMVWGGRARMYALATLLLLLTVYWAYRGTIQPAPAKYRWLALLSLAAALLTQFGALMLIPPLIVAMLVVGWLSWATGLSGSTTILPPPSLPLLGGGEKIEIPPFGGHIRQLKPPQPPRGGRNRADSPLRGARGADVSPYVEVYAFGGRGGLSVLLLQGATLVAIIGLALLVKRLGQPLGIEPLDPAASDGNLLADLFSSTIAYQTTFYFTWADTLDFLARQFGTPHHFWLTLITLTGAAVALITWFITRKSPNLPISQSPTLPISHPPNPPISQSPTLFPLFLWLIFGLLLLQMVTLLEPFRRNPRYLVMFLPLFYLIAAHAVAALLRITFHVLRFTPSPMLQTALSLILLTFFVTIGFNDLRIALLTPEPAYERAFAQVRAEWQPGDVLLTMNTPAAELYVGQVDGFTVQNEADQFLLNTETGPVDRWVGVPWIGQAAGFNAALNNHRRVWFVIDTIRQPIYFQGNWLAILNTQMGEPFWADDNALVYRTRPDRRPLPTQPEQLVETTVGDSIELIGYTISDQQMPAPNSQLTLTLFWETAATLPTDYTIFLHLRDRDGATLAQRDGLPLNGAYPTSRWQPGETVIDPIDLPLPEDLPPGSYDLFTGLYRLDTLERLPVADDTSGENAIPLGQVTLP